MQVHRTSPFRRRRRLPVASSAVHIAPFPLDQPAIDDGSERSCLTDVGLAHLARGCRGLEKLSLIWCSAISSTGLVRIAENCKNLTSLELQVIQYYLFYSFCCVMKFGSFFSSSSRDIKRYYYESRVNIYCSVSM
jgi:hypothetical protein